jgi:hypothetical protein
MNRTVECTIKAKLHHESHLQGVFSGEVLLRVSNAQQSVHGFGIVDNVIQVQFVARWFSR